MTSPEPSPPALRADAARNRELIVTAARDVFAEQGIDAPLEEVARRAGVGIATLYRRFPTRADLIEGAFECKLTAYVDAVQVALADPDPWRGFCGYLENVCAMQATDRGFADVLTLTFPTAKSLEAKRAEAYHGFAELIARAKAAGKLRDEFVSEDLILLLMANAGVVAATGDAAPDAWRRVLAYMIQAFAAEQAPPLPAPPTKTALLRAMARITRGRH